MPADRGGRGGDCLGRGALDFGKVYTVFILAKNLVSSDSKKDVCSLLFENFGRLLGYSYRFPKKKEDTSKCLFLNRKILMFSVQLDHFVNLGCQLKKSTIYK